MEDYFGLIELALVFGGLLAGWAVLSAQGRRLDRQRAERDKNRGDAP
ncbi:hypothetical protein HNR60_003520 [Rhodopseudomonas rhenobacensis]|uniref:Uncharacterized protein n=1 Tax=Rhodopseudomonas rhenobacensis TaxID=87461 RepID=A0A7W7Z6L3_9BRAD|nr:hypothetical protein [Rhodopseudomonas rhenobacensis]MBB5048750.1 hypothetical protein [Rhodopseudomonas rhenobacensis]